MTMIRNIVITIIIIIIIIQTKSVLLVLVLVEVTLSVKMSIGAGQGSVIVIIIHFPPPETRPIGMCGDNEFGSRESVARGTVAIIITPTSVIIINVIVTGTPEIH